MDHRQPELETVVREAREGTYAVPEFQRGFVWTPAKVLEFADSLVKEFPVGSILTWKSDTAVQRGDSDQPLKRYWLIDGQQRTTALCTLFGQRPDWWDDKQSGTWNEHLEKFDVKLDIGVEELTLVTRRTTSGRYVSVREIFDNSAKLYKMAQRLIQNGQTFTDSADDLAEHLGQVANIKKAKLPIVEIDDAIELTQVAEIFKRLNSTGTPVQQADIYLGVVASRNPGWVNRNFLKFMQSLEKDGFDIEPAFIFRAFTAIGAERTRFRDIRPEFWENLSKNKSWDATKKALQSACEGLRQYGIINSDLAISLNAVVTAAIYRNKFPQEPFGPFVAWMLVAIKDGFFAGPTETRLDRVISAMKNAKSRKQALKSLDDLLDSPQEFSAADFREAGSGRNSVYRLMIYLLAYSNDAKDWDPNGYRIRAEAQGDYSPEWHHIFPRKWLKDNVRNIEKDEIDSVANMAVISAQANRKIAAKSPKEYIADLKLVSRGLLKQQAIPDPSSVTPGRYRTWLRSRADLLADESNKYLRKLRRE